MMHTARLSLADHGLLRYAAIFIYASFHLRKPFTRTIAHIAAMIPRKSITIRYQLQYMTTDYSTVLSFNITIRHLPFSEMVLI
jgi:hypothetical protein